MEPELEQWKATAIDLKSEGKTKDTIIVLLSASALVLTGALVFSMWGWFSTKVECARSREEIKEMKNTCSNKNLNKL